MRRTLMVSIVPGAVGVLAGLVFIAGSVDPRVSAQVPQVQNPVEPIQMPVDPDWKPEGPVPRMPDGKPDLQGVWWQEGRVFPEKPLPRGRREYIARDDPKATFSAFYQPWAMEKAKTLSDKDDPALRCIPSVDGAQGNNIFQIVQTPKWVVYLQETYHGFRLIPTTAGRKHSDTATPSMWGDAVGSWEGDTLVVDMRNFSDRNWIWAQGVVSFHSDALRVVERIRRIAANALQVDRTFYDEKVLTRPWVKPTKVYMLAPYDQIMELMCENTETAALMEAAAESNYGRGK
jgi:hypothetical protein